jgi:predicted phage terminase large subunit-like protein
MLGRNPKGSVMRNSCTTTLYNKFSYDVRDMVLDARFKKVFPDARISSNKTSVTGWNMEESRQVGYFGGGVGSTILGFGCDLVAILDDPIKDVEEALSEHVLEKKWDWYTGVHRSRLENQCPEIHIATRWSRRDIIGRLEELGELDEVIVVPALDDKDESFCEDVGTTEDYQRTREITAPFIWSAEYQQKPVEVKGLLYPRDTLKYFDISGFKPSGNTVAVVDVADTGSDYLACGIFDLIDDQAYLIDVVFTQEPIEITESAVAAALIKNKVTLCRIESNSGGRSFARNVENILRSQGSSTTIEAKPTTQNKGTRMLLKSGMIKEFFWFRNDNEMSTDYKQFMQQLCSTFKDVSKNKHDDAADCITMGAELKESKTYNKRIVMI